MDEELISLILSSFCRIPAKKCSRKSQVTVETLRFTAEPSLEKSYLEILFS